MPHKRTSSRPSGSTAARRKATPQAKATMTEYLAALPADQRRALTKLRNDIRKAAPGAEECISYGIAAFRQGRMLVGLGATPKHCAFYLMSTATIAEHVEDLAAYDASGGTIHFAARKPLPSALVARLVATRLRENAALAGGRTKAKVVTRPAIRGGTRAAGAASLRKKAAEPRGRPA